MIKVGDMVAAYDYQDTNPRRVVGVVWSVDGDAVGIETTAGEHFAAHIKQCRKLRPKSKEVIYCTKYPNTPNFGDQWSSAYSQQTEAEGAIGIGAEIWECRVERRVK
jgi:hypothetical protein